MIDETPSYIPDEVRERLHPPGSPASLEVIGDEDWERWVAKPGPAFRGTPAHNRRRARLGRRYFLLLNEDQKAWAGKHAKSCGSCKRTKQHGDPRRGFCVEWGFMVGQGYPVLCAGHAS